MNELINMLYMNNGVAFNILPLDLIGKNIHILDRSTGSQELCGKYII